MDPLIYLLLGLALGGVIGWLLGVRLRGEREVSPLATVNLLEAELRQQLAQRDGDLAHTRQQLAEAGANLAAALTSRATADQQRLAAETDAVAASKDATEQRARSAELEVTIAGLRVDVRAAQEKLTEHARNLTEQLQQARQTIEQLQTTGLATQTQLQALSNERGQLAAEVRFLNERLATERQQAAQMQEKFLKDSEAISLRLLADTSTKFDQHSAESLGKLLTPLRESLGEFKTSLDSTRKETAAHSALLKDQIGRIGTEAANLAKALKGDVKTLGNWGENMLDQILERSGLQRDVHYRRQQGAKDDAGEQRFLDVIIALPEGASLVIDSKVSLRSYEESVNATDEEARAAQLDRHVEALRTHFKGLGGKRYQDLQGLKTPDYVLMYVPIEAAYFAAVAREPRLFAEALDQNVVLITNSTLLATLRTVASVWRLADQQKHALDIADRGGRLYDKFVGFVTDLQKVGDALAGAQRAFDDANNKLHSGTGNLVRQAEQMKALGAKATKSLAAALVEKAAAAEDAPVALPPPP